MRRLIICLFLFVCGATICITACVHKPQIAATPVNGDYPDSIASIILTKCTNAGCHNQASYQNAAGLLLDSWAHLLQGGAIGAEVVAGNPQYSPLLYTINNYYDTPAIQAQPTQGHLATPLTIAQYRTIKNWIAAGARDRNGNIPFATNPDTRQKIYLTISGCNLIAVIDAQTRVIMRYIPVGTYPGNESLHDVTVSHDGMNAYLTFLDLNSLLKIDTRTDTVVGAADLSSAVSGVFGNGGWSLITMSPNDTALMLTGYLSAGYAVSISTGSMLINNNLSRDEATGGSGTFVWPHGIAANATYDTFFASLQYGNIIDKFTFAPHFSYTYLSIDGNSPVTTHNTTTPDPHQVIMSPDHSRYFVSCQNTNELRIMDAHKDTLIAAIPVGTYPQEMSLSPSRGYLFVACMQDSNAYVPAGGKGSVYVIDYTTNTVAKVIYGDFYQPHDVAVDEQDGLLYICSTNAAGAPPHHVLGNCSGRDGWYTVFDINTWQTDNKRYQVSVFPYSIAARF